MAGEAREGAPPWLAGAKARPDRRGAGAHDLHSILRPLALSGGNTALSLSPWTAVERLGRLGSDKSPITTIEGQAAGASQSTGSKARRIVRVPLCISGEDTASQSSECAVPPGGHGSSPAFRSG